MNPYCRKTLRWAIASLVLATLTTNLALAETAQEILEKVKKKYDSINDAELKFSQRLTFELSKQEQAAEGTLSIKKQNKYRFETANRLVVTDGVTVWSYSPLNKQVVIDKFKLDERTLTPEKVLTAAPKDYYASAVGTEKIGKTETRMLKLVPKDEDSIVRTMKMWVDETTWLIKRVEIVDIDGKHTTYTVHDIKINVGIPDSRFTYEIPAGVEAVDLR